MTLVHQCIAIATPADCSPTKDFVAPQKSICVMKKSMVYEAASISCDSNKMTLYDVEASTDAKTNLLDFAMERFGADNQMTFWVKGLKDSSCSTLRLSDGIWVVNSDSSCTDDAFALCEYMSDPMTPRRFNEISKCAVNEQFQII